MSRFNNQLEYHSYLESIATLPAGFRAASTALTFLPGERPSAEPYKMDMSAIVLDEPTDSFAGVFTRNAVPGAPVLIARERLGRDSMQGVLINNRISNVAAAGGKETALRLASAAAREFGIDEQGLFPSSTGIIGWALPEREMTAALPSLCANLNGDSRGGAAGLKLARSIMTTDSYPKLRSVQIGDGRITAVCKGAGMIEPNMATMLVFIMTDLDVDRESLRRLLSDTIHDSFNAISVDSDQSTSDMVLAFSSRKIPVELATFETEFRKLCMELSLDIVRNGEGTGHVLEITATGHEDVDFLRALAKAVGNSPLVKTAMYGNDPNVGRILSAIGDCAGNAGRRIHSELLCIKIGDETVFHRGVFDLNKDKETVLAGYLSANSQNPRIQGYPQNDRKVSIFIDLGEGALPGANAKKAARKVRIFASDLGHEYVTENADYRT